jgi:hypothetical protein
MSEMQTHWRKLINPDYLGAYSLDNGNGTYRTAVYTITNVKQEEVTGPDGKKMKLVVYLKESRKPMILNSTNSRTLEKLFKTAYIERWVGRRFEVGVEKVRVGREYEDALRIKKTIPIGDGPLVCVDCSEEIKDTTTDKGTFKAAQIVAISRKRYSEDVCIACQKKRDAAEKEAAEAEAAERAAEEAAQTEPAEVTEVDADAANE